MRPVEVPVLIVGAGPVGATAAVALARHGVASLVVDRRDGPHRAPQAHVVNPRSLEIFRSLGVDTRALRAAATPRADASHVAFVRTLAGTEVGRLPYERQDDGVLTVTPEPLLNLSQHRLEPVLIDRVRAAGVDLRWRHEWQALEQDAAGVTSRVRDFARGEDHTVRSRWVLAADGAGSRVRKALGVAMVGPDRLQSFVMIHFEANLRALVRARPAILYFIVEPECTGTFVAHDIDRTWVFMHGFDPDTEPASTFTPTRCESIVRRAIGRTDVDLAVRDVSPWTMTAQVAEAFRAGRVFLLGDSAHRFPPTGGLGLNTGVADAHNLAWKLAWVDSRRADERLLQSYDAERRPVAQRNAEQSLANALKMLELVGELGLADEPAGARARLDEALASPEGMARIRRAIADQRDHFDMLGLQLGYAYEDGAVVPDGSALAVPGNPVRDFLPTARPGSRLPHAWVRRDGVRCSILDLLSPTGWTLIAGVDGAGWRDAVARAAPRGLACLVAGLDFLDPDVTWQRACEIDAGGAVLVRPDQHVAWRAARTPADPATALAAALRRVAGVPDR